MADQESKVPVLGGIEAYQLANVNKTVPQFGSITPRWLTRFLDWKPLETGIFRLNQVKEGETPLDILCNQQDDENIPQGFVDYESNPESTF